VDQLVENPDIPTPSPEDDDLTEGSGVCGYPFDRTAPEFPVTETPSALYREGEK
jgi:hypothetical protein